MNTWNKIESYARASFVRGSLNLKGCPLLPKKCWNQPLHNRGAFNTFLIWIHHLHLQEVNWVLDVGANHGDFAEAVATIFPKANVLLVEPLTQLHGELEHRCANNKGRWLLEKSALGAADAVMPIYIANANDAIGSLAGFSREYRAANPGMETVRQESCNVTTLDNVSARHQIKTVDLLKIDVEGFEFEALRGGLNTLANTRSIIIEVSFVRKASKIKEPLLEMLALLVHEGFQIIEIVPSLYDPIEYWKPLEFNVIARR